jgi:hypothetical protein
MKRFDRRATVTKGEIPLRRRYAVGLGAVFCAALMAASQAPLAHAGVDAASACREAKAKAAGKQAGDMLKALAKDAKSPDPVKLQQSVSKAESKLTKAFVKAEGKGGCETIGDVDDVKGGVEGFIADVSLTIAPESASGTTTVTTDDEGDGSTPYDPVETTVTDPGGGSITITETTTTVVPPPGFTLLGTEVDINIAGPVPTPVDPYVLIFRLDTTLSSAIILTALELLDVHVFQYNATFPDGRLVNPCTGDAATPDPCVRKTLDAANNDVVLTVFTTTASRWVFGTPLGTPDDCCTALNPQTVNFSFTGTDTCGILRNFRCTGDPAAACVTDFDCPGTGPCIEVVAGNLPLDLECGALYFGGGASSVEFPVVLPGNTISSTDVASCDATSGVLTLGAKTAAETGSARTCTSGHHCSGGGAAHCNVDSDCPATETCNKQCLFGAPVPIPNTTTPAVSVCAILDVLADADGTATCNGDVDLALPLTMNVFLNGDLFHSGNPPDIPGPQGCPLCVRQCVGGVSDLFPCTDDTDCVAGFCSTATSCMGGPNDGLSCTPGSADLGDSYRTSHDCPSSPMQDITPTGGIFLDFTLTTGQRTMNGYDAFCGGQANPGAFGESEATQISLTGRPAPPSLAGDSRLVAAFCVSETDSAIINAAADLSGPAALMLLGEVTVAP